MRECIRRYKPDFLVLQETKKEKFVPLLIRSIVGRDLSSWIEIPLVVRQVVFF